MMETTWGSLSFRPSATLVFVVAAVPSTSTSSAVLFSLDSVRMWPTSYTVCSSFWHKWIWTRTHIRNTSWQWLSDIAFLHTWTSLCILLPFYYLMNDEPTFIWVVREYDTQVWVLVEGLEEDLCVGGEEEDKWDVDIIGAVARHGKHRRGAGRGVRRVVQHNATHRTQSLQTTCLRIPQTLTLRTCKTMVTPIHTHMDRRQQ